jgi:hypothetical protein
MQPQSDIPSQWTTEGFNKRFDEIIKTGVSYLNAYIQAEEEHVKLFGRIRFKSYESFRSSRKNLLFPNT